MQIEDIKNLQALNQLQEAHLILRTSTVDEMYGNLRTFEDPQKILKTVDTKTGLNFIESLVVLPQNDVENKLKSLKKNFKNTNFDILGFLFLHYFPQQMDIGQIINGLIELDINWDNVEKHTKEPILFTLSNKEALLSWNDVQKFVAHLKNKQYDFEKNDNYGNTIFHQAKVEFIDSLKTNVNFNPWQLNNKKEIFLETQFKVLKLHTEDKAKLWKIIQNLDIQSIPPEAVASFKRVKSILVAQLEDFKALGEATSSLCPFLEKIILKLEDHSSLKNQYQQKKL